MTREYPDFALVVAAALAVAGILPPFIVFFVRKCQRSLMTTDDEVSEAELRRVGTASSTLPMIARETKMNCDVSRPGLAELSFRGWVILR